MKASDLSARGLEAAKRIAARNDVPVEKVVQAFAKAARSSSPLNAKLLFLNK